MKWLKIIMTDIGNQIRSKDVNLEYAIRQAHSGNGGFYSNVSVGFVECANGLRGDCDVA